MNNIHAHRPTRFDRLQIAVFARLLLMCLAIWAALCASAALAQDAASSAEPLAEESVNDTSLPNADSTAQAEAVNNAQSAEALDTREVAASSAAKEESEEAKPAERASDAEKELGVDGAQEAKAADQPAALGGQPLAKMVKGADPLLQRTYRKAMLIDMNGDIFDGMKTYMTNRLDAAERGECDLIVVRITSPGGELDASLELARRLSKIDWATTIAFVPEETYSGAAIVALGCDRIYMRPGALIGDAGPIRFYGGLFEHAEEKVVSKLAAAIRQLADAKQRPAAIAEAMVDRKVVVHEVRDKTTGERTYLTADESQTPLNQQKYDIGAAIPESGQNRFLTVTGSRAVELMIAEGTFDSERAMLAALQIDELVETRRTWVDRTVFVLNRPFVTGLLLLIGLIGMYVEFSVPGISVAGMISVLCFGMFFWSHALGGTSGWLEIMMFALGIGCLGIELFVLPGFGVFGVTGLILVVLSLVMASQDFVLPQSTVQWNTLRNNLLIVLGAMASLVVALILQVAFFDSLPGLGRFRLEAPDVEPAPTSDSVGSLAAGSFAGMYLPQVGELGIADSVLRPAGKVRFDGRLVDVVTEGDFLDPGTHVEVIRREGNHVIVRHVV